MEDVVSSVRDAPARRVRAQAPGINGGFIAASSNAQKRMSWRLAAAFTWVTFLHRAQMLS
jgi:hypothetical protein